MLESYKPIQLQSCLNGQAPNRAPTKGENHAQWSIRIANGMLNIIDDLSNSYQSINITHRGAIFEIQKLVEMINGQIMFDDVEKYETKWMSYCNDYLLHIVIQ